MEVVLEICIPGEAAVLSLWKEWVIGFLNLQVLEEAEAVMLVLDIYIQEEAAV